MAVRLEWEGKPTQVERLALPFQTVETINESKATRERDTGALFGGTAAEPDARNLLIWGDNKLPWYAVRCDVCRDVGWILASEWKEWRRRTESG